ncbi:hypothetical protein ACFL6U_30170 [Planctomycetota bacterium]
MKILYYDREWGEDLLGDNVHNRVFKYRMIRDHTVSSIDPS